ncbi:hypothetical protein [Mesoterricola silvestris]|uniref:Uncharacterized protein n=1 Tax=Mesoterricola silvestris TaxID=2927979 RepID=A0AA48K9N1_9BACT|nr:hypothetical protein [Mesoterricola silvestris]BDU72502.1 hypothetical protein METEAL_16760 [Mesoterricola silvestris]
MDGIFLEPWLPPPEPGLARLAMEAADEAGLRSLDRWPEFRKGGIGFGDLPPFLAWHGVRGGHHLILVQPREVGALVPGARAPGLPEGWLEDLDLEALARPLARHPGFPGGASVHVVRILGPGRFKVRSWGEAPGDLVAGVLGRISGVRDWSGSA